MEDLTLPASKNTTIKYKSIEVNSNFLYSNGLEDFVSWFEKLDYVRKEILLRYTAQWLSVLGHERLQILYRLIMKIWSYRVPDTTYYERIALVANDICRVSKFSYEECFHRLEWGHKITCRLKQKELDAGWRVNFCRYNHADRYFYLNSETFERKVIQFYK